MDLPVSPGTLLALATALFLLGCLIIGFWPNRWRLALLVILPASALTVWLVFGPELRDLLATLR